MRRRTIAAAAFLALSGCRASEPPPKTYEVRGQVVTLRPDVREVRLAHENIDGYMPAMTMSFGVKHIGLFEGLERGDLVTATLVVASEDAWLTSIRKTGHQPVSEAAESGYQPIDGVAGPSPSDLLEPGQPVPDEQFTDQEGRPFSLSSTRGRTVVLTFIYTRCPLPDFCPRIDRNLVAAQQIVSKRNDLRGKVQFLSISFDPTFDTPAVLRRHATAIGADPALWRFLTGDPEKLARFATGFGVSIVREPGDLSTITHNLRTAVIAPDGRLATVLSGTDWTAEALVAEMTGASSS